MPSVVESVRQELIAKSDQATKQSFNRFFKENVSYYGVKTTVVRRIAAKFWSEIRACSKAEVFALCEELYRSGVTEEATVAALWLPNLADVFEPSDLEMFRNWIEKYVDNWAKCDTLCNHTIGSLVEKFPAYAAELKSWAKSGNRWLRRAAAVTLIIPAKRGDFLQEAFDISSVLLRDEDDMVQKGYGWLLKEESRMHQQQVFDFVKKNKQNMPRTALRYAIELMPKKLKAQLMRKD
jgi:3-methyladenine DNA glycosylase AlkD